MSGTTRTSLKLTERRKRLLNKVKNEAGENTNSKAIDTALKNYLDMVRKAEELEERFQEEADNYSTSQIEFDVSVEIKA